MLNMIDQFLLYYNELIKICFYFYEIKINCNILYNLNLSQKFLYFFNFKKYLQITENIFDFSYKTNSIYYDSYLNEFRKNERWLSYNTKYFMNSRQITQTSSSNFGFWVTYYNSLNFFDLKEISMYRYESKKKFLNNIYYKNLYFIFKEIYFFDFNFNIIYPNYPTKNFIFYQTDSYFFFFFLH